MSTPKDTRLGRIFGEIVRQSRTSGQIRRAQLSGGVELVVDVADDVITLTIKRPRVKLSSRELIVFRDHFGIPADAAVLTPPEQAVRHLNLDWYYMSYRWKEASYEPSTTPRHL